MCLSTLYNAGLLHFNVVALLLLGQIINRVTISFWKRLTQPADAITYLVDTLVTTVCHG